jgi:hypothetical protein
LRKITGLIICLGFLAGCATGSPGPAISKTATAPSDAIYVASFNYTAPAQAAPLSNKVTFTVLNPAYKASGSLLWMQFPQFAKMDEAAKQDLTEILIAKGFGVRGPFDSYDLIPFQDKKDIDLLLIVTLAPTIDIKDIKEVPTNDLGKKSPTAQTGNAEVSGTVNIELRESATKELMWAKSVPIKKFEHPFTSVIPWGESYVPGKIYNYSPVVEGIAKGIEQQYPDIMATIYNLIDAQEMAILQKQAQELKSKRGY